MTRIAVLSDIHGNLPALDAVLQDLTDFSVDRIVVAGDVLNWGPFTDPVTERLVALDCAIIRGNNELYLLDHDTPRAPAEWKDYTISPWTLNHLEAYWLNVIAAWPDTLTLRFRDAPALRVVHGSARSAFEPIYPSVSEEEAHRLLIGIDETTVIAAHTHLAMDRHVGRWHILNPGTVGVPLDGIFGASYMILEGNLEGWRATLRRVNYDYTPLFDEFERTRFVKECGVSGYLAVQEYRMARPQVHPFNNWRQTCHADHAQDFALLELFADVDWWDYLLPAYQVNLELRPDRAALR